MRLKLILVSLLTVIIFFPSTSVFAEEVLWKNDKGEVIIMQEPEKLARLSKEEKQAYKNPGEEIEVNVRDTRYERISFFYQVPIEKYDTIVFKNGKITVKTGLEKRGEQMIAMYVILLLFAVLFMVISNILYNKTKGVATIAAAFAAIAAIPFVFAATTFVFAAFTFAFAATPLAILAAAFFALGAFFIALAADIDEIDFKIYKYSSALFYISTLIGFVVY